MPGTPLSKDEATGNWFVFSEAAQPGQEYNFVIKNGDQLTVKNDPRALQLSASSERSIIVDTSTFDWQDDNFQLGPVEEQVIYELHIGTFNRPDPSTPGTFASAIEKLDYLVDLGITTIEVMPCSETRESRWWGYTPDHLYATSASYGGRFAFMEFVRQCHLRGLAVILDVVYNHMNADPNLDLLQFDGWHEKGMGGIYFYNDWRAVTPWGDTRLDYGRPEVRTFVTDNVRMWLEDCHVDGLRVDATNYIRNVGGQDDATDNDLADGWKMLQDITTTAHKVTPHALIIAEDTANNAAIVQPASDGGAGFTAQWDLSLPYWLRKNLSAKDDGERSLAEIEQAIIRTYNDNAFSRVIFSESHDLDANGRARLNEEISPGDSDDVFARRRSSLAAALVLTSPGIPMLFQGQEFIENGSFSHWNELDWSKAEQFHGMVQLYKDLIKLRKNRDGISAGLLGDVIETLHLDEATKVLAYARGNEETPRVVIVMNFSNTAHHDYKLTFPENGWWKARFNSDWQGYSADYHNTHTPDVEVTNGSGNVNIAPYSAVIFSQD